MAGCRHNDVRMRRKSHRHRILAAWWPNHHRQVGQIVGQMTQQTLAVMHGEVKGDAGVSFGKRLQHPRKEIVASADDCNIELTTGHALEPRYRVLGFLE